MQHEQVPTGAAARHRRCGQASSGTDDVFNAARMNTSVFDFRRYEDVPSRTPEASHAWGCGTVGSMTRSWRWTPSSDDGC